MSFKIGEKVVCVDDSPAKIIQLRGVIGHLVLNEMYTIRGIIHTPNGVGFLLEEIVNTPFKFKESTQEPCYDTKRFRKLDYDFAENLLKEIKEQVLAESLK